MDDQLLLQLYHQLFDPPQPQQRCRGPDSPLTLAPSAHCTYPDTLIALIYLLGVIRDRSSRWASEKRNWPLWMRRLPAPSYSQLRRRLRSDPVQGLIVRLLVRFGNALPRSAQKICDGKPLTVGGYSKDPDATRGKLPGKNCWGRGYKLHLILDACSGVVELFTVSGLAEGEPTVMRRLLHGRGEMAGLGEGVVLNGDNNYDSNRLYAAVAESGARLLAPRKRPGTGLGHGHGGSDGGEHHPDRLRAIGELEGPGASWRLKLHRRRRARVERSLGQLTNLPFGLSPLPNFVRRKPRVTLWVLAKIMFYHLALMLRQTKQLAA